jgi:hypothetical protein
MLEIVPYNLRLFPGIRETRTNPVHHRLLVWRSLSADSVAFDGLARIRIRIQFRAVARDKIHFHFVFVFFQTARHRPRLVNRRLIQNQKNLVAHASHQPLRKLDHARSSESLGEKHESKRALVRDGRHHGAGKTLTWGGDDGRFPFNAVQGAGLMIAAQPHLIAPMDSIYS